jgi:hypothetical protein
MDAAMTHDDEDGPCCGGLIKLRDLSDNRWHVDTLYCLCPDVNGADQLMQIAVADQWEFDSHHRYADDLLSRSLMENDRDRVLLEFWWD